MVSHNIYYFGRKTTKMQNSTDHLYFLWCSLFWFIIVAIFVKSGIQIKVLMTFQPIYNFMQCLSHGSLYRWRYLLITQNKDPLQLKTLGKFETALIYMKLDREIGIWMYFLFVVRQTIISYSVTFTPIFSIIRYFLPNPGRIRPTLTERSKLKKLPLVGIEPTTSRS